MPGYADLADVKSQLRISDVDEDDAIDVARLEKLNESLSQVFDSKVGRTWGAGGPVTRTIEGGYLTIVLPTPVVSVSEISTGGTWNGFTWAGEEVWPVGSWMLSNRDSRGNFHQIKGASRLFYGPVRVTGVWADDPGGDVPADVRDALTWLVVHHYREETASPAGQIGPDGMIVQTRNPWTFERVKEPIEKHRVRRAVVF